MSLSRRHFLDAAIQTTAATMAGMPLVLSANENPAKSAGPNERVRVAVIGTNGQGGAHIGEWLKHPDVDLVAVCDCDPAAYHKHAALFKAVKNPPRFEQDIRKLLEDKSIHAVSIAAPNHWHALAAVWAMQAGKDVYVEKPCSHTVHEGRVMTQWARSLGRICQMGVQSRSMTGMRDLLQFVKGGTLGTITAARAICYRRRDSIGVSETEAPIPPGLDFDLWCGPTEKVVPKRKRLHYDWHWFWATGAGDLGNQNPHELDKARWGLGKQEFPKRVISVGGRLGYVDDAEVANSQITVFQWDDALLISDVRGLPLKSPVSFGSHSGPFQGAANIWYGSEGYAVGLGYTGGVAFDYDGHELGKWNAGEYQQHFANFLKGVKSRNHKDLHLDIEDGHLSSALAHMGNVSLRRGRIAAMGERPSRLEREQRVAETFDSFEQHLAENDMDLEKTKFFLGADLVIDPMTERSSDVEANALFTRQYRKGFELPEVLKA